VGLIAMALIQAELFMSYFLGFPSALMLNLGMLALAAGLLYTLWTEPHPVQAADAERVPAL
jgi:hypothetical protein